MVGPSSGLEDRTNVASALTVVRSPALLAWSTSYAPPALITPWWAWLDVDCGRRGRYWVLAASPPTEQALPSSRAWSAQLCNGMKVIPLLRWFGVVVRLAGRGILQTFWTLVYARHTAICKPPTEQGLPTLKVSNSEPCNRMKMLHGADFAPVKLHSVKRTIILPLDCKQFGSRKGVNATPPNVATNFKEPDAGALYIIGQPVTSAEIKATLCAMRAWHTTQVKPSGTNLSASAY